MTAKICDKVQTTYAPAKVNLSLHVGPPKPNGRHDLMSLIMFADARAADIISLQTGSAELEVTGPFAQATGPVEDNLVWRAMQALCEVCPDLTPPPTVTLTKSLPCAAGIGGGSADAGAMLRLLSAQSDTPDNALKMAKTIAPKLGGDVLACLYSQTGMMSGEGEAYAPVSGLPSLPAVLVNCGAPCPTGPVFRAYDADAPSDVPAHETVPKGESRAGLIEWIAAKTQNSLEASAMQLVPEIGYTLDKLTKLNGVRLARMSGSGATCFALFETEAEAERASTSLTADHPDWWVTATELGGDAACI